MTRTEEIINKLRELKSDYWFITPSGSQICLDGDFTIEQLKLFIELIEIQEQI